MGKTPPSDEKRQQNVRLDAEEESRLARVAGHYGIGGPALLRMLLKREESALFGDAPLLPAGAGEFTVGGVVYVVVPLTDAIEIVAHVEIVTAGALDAIADLKRLTKNENNPNKA